MAKRLKRHLNYSTIDVLKILSITWSLQNLWVILLPLDFLNRTVNNVDIQLIANLLSVNVEKENIKITTLPTLGKIAIKDWTKIIVELDYNR